MTARSRPARSRVIAGGIDIVYPPENEERQRAIAERGLLIAEQPPGTEPRARHFPYRNRIIAGLAHGTVVIEAAPKSGSLITARLAADYGREVMAVPGSPLDPRAQGCNLLIREGATLIQIAEDVLEAISPSAIARPRPQPERARPDVHGAQADAGDAERRALADLLGPTPVPVDELIRQSGLAPAWCRPSCSNSSWPGGSSAMPAEGSACHEDAPPDLHHWPAFTAC